MPYMDVNGLRTQYEAKGEGTPVLILPGWMSNIEAMRPVVNAVSKIGMRAIALDFPGFGGSDEPPEAWGVPEYAAFTRAFVKQMGIVGCDVVCHSFGGRITILLASEEKALFNRLVLIDAAGIRPKRGIKWYVRTYAYKTLKLFCRIPWLERTFRLNEKRKNKGSGDYQALKSDLMRAVFVKVVNLDLTDRLPRVANPTLLIWGSEDQMTPLYMGELMEKRIPDAGLAVFEGAGHYSYADQYSRFCAVLKAFFQA